MSRRSRFALIGLGSLLALILLVLGGLYAMTQSRLDKTYQIEPRVIEIPSDSASLSSGENTARFSCAGCHGEDLSGQAISDSILDGRASAPNLTSGQGGIGASYTDADWVRAIWHGVDPDGRALIGMPSDQFTGLDYHSLGALIAYLQSVPPVDNDLPASTVGLLSRINFLFGSDPLLAAELIDHAEMITPGTTPPNLPDDVEE